MRVLAIGVATLDIVNIVPDYPAEDDELRAEGQEIRRGGNATNTLVVLSQLGHQCSWAGTLANDLDSQSILNDLAVYGIDAQACRQYSQGKNPTSYIILSQSSGSRTIVHYRDLPEYLASDFTRIDTAQFDWVHFEGRNVSETREMMRYLKQKDPFRRISLEVEKDRDGMDSLFPLPDLLLFSKAYSLAQGHADAASLFSAIRPCNKQALLVCAWGEQGAWLQHLDGRVDHAPAFSPSRIIDTLGAGDVFNAGMIDGLLRGHTAGEALTDAVRLAGIKCGCRGFDGLVEQND
ncbi:MAG: PfkB family carbohydrate kinase [Pseudomonadota bacterium]